MRTLLGAPPSHEVVFGRSVSELMSILAVGLAKDTRTQVVLSANCHPAAIMPWSRQARLDSFVCGNPDSGVRRSELKSLLTDNVLAVVFSHLTHLTGDIEPISEVAELALAGGAVAIIDGAQAVGRIAIDCEPWDQVVYLGTGRKALMAPMGTGFMVGPTSLFETLEPLIASTRSADLFIDPSGYPRTTFRGVPERLEGNLPDLAALAALGAALDCAALTHFSIVDHADRVARSFTSVLSERLPAIQVDNGGTGIVRLRLPDGVLGVDAKRQLEALGFTIAAAEAELRVSTHTANTEEDAVGLADALANFIEAQR